MKFKILLIFVVISLAVFANGCARTVTPLVQFGSEVVVEVSFRGNVNFSTNRYYMIIGSTESYELPYYPDDFIEPGIPPQDPTYDPYRFYRSWQGYIVSDSSSNYFLVNGPFNNTSETYTRTNIGHVSGNISNKIQFRFRLDQMFGTTVPDVMYFDVAAVDSQLTLRNHLQPPSKYINTYQGALIQGEDDVDSSVNSSLDIVSWKVFIQ